MVSIKKYLILAIFATVLIGAVVVKAEEEKKDEAAGAAPEETADKKSEGDANPLGNAHGAISDFGSKIFSGFKNAGKTIMSHIPFLSNGAAKKGGDEKADAASGEGTEAPAQEAKADAKEESKDKSE